MKSNFKKGLVTALAVVTAAATLIGGGTYAYLQGTTDDVVNNFDPNQFLVELDETTGDSYEIIPGTSQDKNPTVKVNATIPAYVYVTVTDETDGLVTYEIADGWTLVDGYDNMYYREVAGSDTQQEFPVLKNNSVSYDAALENGDMVDADGNLKTGLKLTFNASAIQKEPFNDPLQALRQDIGWDGVSTEALDVSPEDGAYHVYNEDQLAYLTQFVPAANMAGKTVILEKDMFLNGHLWTPFGGKVTSPYGDAMKNFTWDGNGHIIYDLLLRGGNNYYWGLIRQTKGSCTVKNLTVNRLTVWGAPDTEPEYISTNGVGTFVGMFSGNLTVENCHVKNGDIIGYGKVGGLVGFDADSGKGESLTIKNCSVSDTRIEAMYNAGGAVGLIKRMVTLDFENVDIQDSVQFIPLGTYVHVEDKVKDTCGPDNRNCDCPLQGQTISGDYWEFQTGWFDVPYGKYFVYYGNLSTNGSNAHGCDLESGRVLNGSTEAVNSLDQIIH